MALDLQITGGTVVDGTGAPPRRADVGVAGGRVVAVAEPGSLDPGATRTIDADGLVVAPGFVDLHTHYDAQLLWDPTASPSPLHGVTTVFGGNCGFGIAPASSDHVDYLARLLARVEGIPLDAITAGVPFDWDGFGTWLDRLQAGGIAVNAGFLAGHSTIRRTVMGADAVGEVASPAQVDAMVALLRTCLAEGALGFSTSRSDTHHDGDGAPVPSRAADDDELLALSAAVADFPGTQLEAIIPGCIRGFTDEDKALLGRLSAAADRPLNWNVLAVAGGDGHIGQLSAGDAAAAQGGRVVALTLPQGMRIRLSFASGMVLDALPGWADVFVLPPAERLAALADPDVRRRMDEGAHSPEAGIIGLLANWRRLTIVEAFSPAHRRWEGHSVGEVADATGKDAFDALLDIVVDDGLRTGLSPTMPPESPEVWEARVATWRDPRAMIGGSDAGAHLDMMCGASYSTFMVGPAVRDHGLLPLEEAVALITSRPAELYGVRDRGTVAVGAHADLVLFDPATVGPEPDRTVDDLPGGASRLTAGATGVHHVLVAGTEIVTDGAFTGATPGRVLRAGADTRTVHTRGDGPRTTEGEP